MNLIYPKYENIKKSQDFFNNFESIYFDSKNKYFVFDLDYTKFTNKGEGCCNKWKICSYGERLRNSRDKNSGKWVSTKYDPTERVKQILKSVGIIFEKGDNLKNKISKQKSKEFFQNMFEALKMILQMRNSRIGEDEDYMLSPVFDERQGCFFDSRKALEHEPKNADANGAYHIALKGVMMLKKNPSME